MKRPASNPSELLGLTLCYEDEDEEGNTEIFLDDIHPLGLAAKDGRLRLGDQIIQVCQSQCLWREVRGGLTEYLQISGERVRSKARAQELFRTLRGDISLLVVRPPPAHGYDDDLDNLLDLSQSLSQTKVGRQSKMSLPTLAFKSDEIKQSCFVDKIVGLCEMEILLLHLRSQISFLVPPHPAWCGGRTK